MESPVFKILAWESKVRSSMYLSVAIFAWYLNVFRGISISLMIFIILYLKGTMSILKCKLKGRTYAEEKRRKNKEEDILSEEAHHRIIIALYIAANYLVELFRDII